MLSTDAQRDWQQRFSDMPDPVHLLVFTKGDAPSGAEARRFGEVLHALSRNVRPEAYDVDEKPVMAARYGIARTPAFALLLGGVTIEDSGIRFYGVPTASFKQALVGGIVAVGHSRASLAAFDGCPARQVAWPVHMLVLGPAESTADGHGLFRILRLVASTPRLHADVVGGYFPERAAGHEMGTTMAVIINDAIILREGDALQQYLDALEAASCEETQAKHAERIPSRLVAGGKANGATPHAK